MWNSYGYKPQPSVAQRKAKAAKKLAEMRRKNPDISPVIVSGNTMARTWWGKAWNANLERYAEFESRLSRGRSYVRSGAVLDLRIDRGRVEAVVQGSRAKPYDVEVQIDALSPLAWSRLVESCTGRIDSLPELLEGRFPEGLGELFTTPGKGLFPKPSEIHMSCSCPDWANMCKHVVSALIGVGTRLDASPELFFTLRGVEVGELVSAAAESTAGALLKNTGAASKRVLRTSATSMSALFGVEMDEKGAQGANGAVKSTGKAVRAADMAAPGAKASKIARNSGFVVSAIPVESATPVALAPVAIVAPAAPAAPVAPAAPAMPKKRGRPKKVAEAATPAASATPKKRGRPKKVAEAAPATPVAPAAPKKRGRPKKAVEAATPAAPATPKKRGRPKKVVEAATPVAPAAPMKRGRPQKVAEAAPATPVAPAAPMKRGRPQNAFGTTAKIRWRVR
jgi:uncharacterized Zn finger protein